MNIARIFFAPTAHEVTKKHKEAVQQAAALLDQIAPNWTDKIDLNILDLNDGEDCVLGQAFEEHTGELIVSGGISFAAYSGYEWASYRHKELILLAPGLFSNNDSYLDLWKEAITERQTAKVGTKSDHALVA